MNESTAEPGPGSPAAEIMAGLMSAREFIAAHHAELPLGTTDNPLWHCKISGTPGEKRTEIDRIAALLGVKAGWFRPSLDHETYGCQRDFGAGILYRAFAFVHAAQHAVAESVVAA